ncbi:MAG: hypothetical protein IPL46_29195 [Saprospiraceae bacterium]|nr:hypothetical protein [Saprospiraceae bacterium]
MSNFILRLQYFLVIRLHIGDSINTKAFFFMQDFFTTMSTLTVVKSERQIVTISFADIVGYASMMQEDEKAAFAKASAVLKNTGIQMSCVFEMLYFDLVTFNSQLARIPMALLF